MSGGSKQKDVKETPAQREAARIAAEKYNMAKQFDYLNDEYISRVNELKSEGATDYVQGKANLSTTAAFESAGKQAIGQRMMQGIDPSSGAAAGMNDAIAAKAGTGIGKAMSDSAFEKDSQYLAGKQNIIDIGLGKAGNAQAGLSDIAARSAEQARSDAFNDFNDHAALTQSIGQGAGIGLGIYANRDTTKKE